MEVGWIELCDLGKPICKSGGEAGTVWQDLENETLKIFLFVVFYINSSTYLRS